MLLFLKQVLALSMLPCKGKLLQRGDTNVIKFTRGLIKMNTQRNKTQTVTERKQSNLLKNPVRLGVNTSPVQTTAFRISTDMI